MLDLPIRLLVNALRVVRFLLDWFFFWPFVLLRRRARSFVRLEIKSGLDLPARKGLAALMGGGGASWEGLSHTLERVERSRSTEGVVLHVREMGLGLTDATLLRERLLRLRLAGKRVVCYFDSAHTVALVVASGADTVMMAPAGSVTRVGLRGELTFARDLLRQLGVRAQFLHIGAYKTAGHTFSRSRSTRPQRRMIEDLLGDLDVQVEAMITRGDEPPEAADPARGRWERSRRRRPAIPAAASAPPPAPPRRSEAFAAERVARRTATPTLLVDEARRAGLVHHQAFPDQVKTRLRAERMEPPLDPYGHFGDERLAEEHARRLGKTPPVVIHKASAFLHQRPRRLELAPLWGSRPEIAVVEMSGIIVPDEAVPGPLGSRPHISPDAVRKVFRRLRESGRVKAVVLALDSRGGSALASDLIWREVRRLTRRKPVIAALRSVAASGGYYIAVGAHEIVADATTITGSIGVVAGKFSGEAAFEKARIHTETWATDPWATLMSPRHAWTAEHLAALRQDIRAFYRRFLNRVALGRRMKHQRVHLLGRGRVYTGRQALRRGLVDQVGSLALATERAADRAGLRLERARVTYHALTPPTLRALLMGGGRTSTLQVLEPRIGDALDLAALLQRERVLAYFDGFLPR